MKNTQSSLVTNDTKTKKMSKLHKFIRGYLRRQYREMIEEKRERFNLSEVSYSAKIIFYRGSILDEQYFLIKVSGIYRNEKNKLKQKIRRIEKNSDLLRLENIYPHSKVMLMAKELGFYTDFNHFNKKHIQLLEDIIRLALNKSLVLKTFEPRYDDINAFIIDSLKLQCKEILYEKRQTFNFHEILYEIKQHFSKSNIKKQEIMIDNARKFYKMEKKKLQMKHQKLANFEAIKRIEEQYQESNVLLIVKHLSLEDLFFSLKKDHINLIVDLIKFAHNKRLHVNVK